MGSELGRALPAIAAPLQEQALVYYRALLSRDSRFDGRFFAAVLTTRVYCRPICPARKPRFEHCRFFRSSAEAQQGGFRPCKRCRPEHAPTPGASAAAPATVTRALSLIASGALTQGGIHDLSARLGVTPRHLRRLFGEHVGVSPQRYATTHRLGVASQLLHHSTASITAVALASGFQSLRRFNSAFREVYDMSPSRLRQEFAAGGRTRAAPLLRLELPFRRPYDWTGTLAFLGQRAIPGLERTGPDCYARSIRVRGADGFLTVSPNLTRSCLEVEIRLPEPSSILGLVEQIRSLFDLDADPEPIADTLGRDRRLRPCFDRAMGLRVPGGWDMFELGVRTILGQQVTVSGARTLCRRLVDGFGDPNLVTQAQAAGCTRHFPTPSVLAEADLRGIGMPGSRIEAVRRFAAFVAERGEASPGVGLVEALRWLPGLGPWSVSYIRLRGLRDPDAFPAGDAALLAAARQLGIAGSAAELSRAADGWRPWRGYAAMALWRAHAAPGPARQERS